MGARSSKNFDRAAIDHLYEMAIGKKVGGFDDIIEGSYQGGLSHKSKETLIEMFYRLLREKLNIGKDKPEAKTTDEMVDFINKYTPLRSKGIKTVKNADETLEKSMKTVAKSINTEFGRNVIDESLPPLSLYTEIVNLIKSINAGYGKELEQIRMVLETITNNISIVHALLKSNMDNFVNRLEQADKDSTVAVREAFDKLNEALSSQVAALEGIMDNLSPRFIPAAEDVNRLFGVSEETSAGKMLSYLEGLSGSALYAKKVKKALESVGLSASEYKKIDFKDLKKLLDKVADKALNDAEASELRKILENIKILKQAWRRRDTIVGSAELSKRLKKAEDLRKNLIEYMIRALDDQIMYASEIIKEISKDIIKNRIVYTDTVAELIKNIRILEPIGDARYIDYLSGIEDSPDARLYRERFIERLSYISSLFEEVGQTNKEFGALGIVFSKIREIIIDVSQRMLDETKNPGGKGIVSVAMPNLKRLGLEFTNLKETIIHIFKVGQLKNNLARVADSMNSNLEDYANYRGRYLSQLREKWETDAGVHATNGKDERLGLFKVAESIDEYLIHFAEAFARNPEDLLILMKMIEQSEIMSTWFSTEALKALIMVMELNPKGNNNTFNNVTNINRQFYYDLIRTGVFPGNPLLNSNDAKYAEKLARYLGSVFDNFTALKNIISLFVTIGEKFGNKFPGDSSYMSMRDVYDTLVRYIRTNSIDTSGLFNTAPVVAPINVGTISDGGGLLLGVGDAAAAKLRSIYHAAAHDGAYPPAAGGDGDYLHNFDRLFIHIIKAIVGKILATINYSNIINIPSGPKMYLKEPVERLTMGGDEIDVTPDMLKLVKCIWLVEYYYKNFYESDNQGLSVFNHTFNAVAYSLVFLPTEITGVFRGLIKKICFDFEHSLGGNYGIGEIEELAFELNKILNSYGSPEEAFNSAIFDLKNVIEENIGLYKAADIVLYKAKHAHTAPGLVTGDIGLRPVDDGRMSYISPLTMYLKKGENLNVPDYLNVTEWKEIKEFIRKIYDRLNGDINNHVSNIIRGDDISAFFKVIDKSVDLHVDLLKTLPNKQERIIMMAKLVRLFARATDTVSMKSVVLFHEIVLVPQFALYAVMEDLKRFRKMLEYMEGQIKIVWQRVDQDDNAGAHAGNPYIRSDVNYMMVGRMNGVYNVNPEPASLCSVNGLHSNISGLNDMATVEASNLFNQAGGSSRLRRFRYLLPWDRIVLDFINGISQHSNSGVGFVLNKGGNDFSCIFDYSKLKDNVFNTLKSLKISSERFRTILDEKTITMYDKDIFGVYNMELYFEEYFRTGAIENAKMCDYIIKQINMDYWDNTDGGFVEATNVQAQAVDSTGARAGPAPEHSLWGEYDYHRNSYFHLFSMMIAIDPIAPVHESIQVSVIGSGDQHIYAKFNNLVGKTSGTLSHRMPAIAQNEAGLGYPAANTAVAAAADPTSYVYLPRATALCDFRDGYRSLIMSLNRLASVYLDAVTDRNLKVYENAIVSIYNKMLTFTRTLGDRAWGNFTGTLETDYLTHPNGNLVRHIIRKELTTPIAYDYDYARGVITNRHLSRGRDSDNESDRGVIFRHVFKTVELLCTTEEKKGVLKYLVLEKSSMSKVYFTRVCSNIKLLRNLFSELINHANIIMEFVDVFNVCQILQYGARSMPKPNSENRKYFRNTIYDVIDTAQTFIDTIDSLLLEVSEEKQYLENDINAETNGYLTPSSSFIDQCYIDDKPVTREPYNVAKYTYSFNQLSVNSFQLLPDVNFGPRTVHQLLVDNIFEEPVKMSKFKSMEKFIGSANNILGQRSSISPEIIEMIVSSYINNIKRIIGVQSRSLFCIGYVNELNAVNLNCFKMRAIGAYNNAAGANALTEDGEDVETAVPVLRNTIFQDANGPNDLLKGKPMYALRGKELRVAGYVDLKGCGKLLTNKHPYAFHQENFIADAINMAYGRRLDNIYEGIYKDIYQSGPLSTLGRDDLLYYNMVDNNIVPNLSNVLKIFPLSQLLKFSWSFDYMVQERLGTKSPSAIRGGHETVDFTEENPMELFAAMLQSPYLRINRSIYDNILPKLLRGDIGDMRFARPDVLALDIWNTILFGDVINLANKFNATLSDKYGFQLNDTLHDLLGKSHGSRSVAIGILDKIFQRTHVVNSVPGLNFKGLGIYMTSEHFANIIKAFNENNYAVNDNVFNTIFFITPQNAGWWDTFAAQMLGVADWAAAAGGSIWNAYSPMVFNGFTKEVFRVIPQGGANWVVADVPNVAPTGPTFAIPKPTISQIVRLGPAFNYICDYGLVIHDPTENGTDAPHTLAFRTTHRAYTNIIPSYSYIHAKAVISYNILIFPLLYLIKKHKDKPFKTAIDDIINDLHTYYLWYFKLPFSGRYYCARNGFAANNKVDTPIRKKVIKSAGGAIGMGNYGEYYAGTQFTVPQAIVIRNDGANSVPGRFLGSFYTGDVDPYFGYTIIPGIRALKLVKNWFDGNRAGDPVPYFDGVIATYPNADGNLVPHAVGTPNKDLTASIIEKCTIYGVGDLNRAGNNDYVAGAPIVAESEVRLGILLDYAIWDMYCRNPFNMAANIGGNVAAGITFNYAANEAVINRTYGPYVAVFYDLWNFGSRTYEGTTWNDLAGDANMVDPFWREQKQWLYIPQCEITVGATTYKPIFNKAADDGNNLADMSKPDMSKLYGEYSNPQSQDSIQVYDTNGKMVDYASPNAGIYKTIGYLRFDTVLMRNIFWIMNIQRFLHAVIRTDFSPFKTPLATDIKILSQKITESDYQAESRFFK